MLLVIHIIYDLPPTGFSFQTDCFIIYTFACWDGSANSTAYQSHFMLGLITKYTPRTGASTSSFFPPYYIGSIVPPNRNTFTKSGSTIRQEGHHSWRRWDSNRQPPEKDTKDDSTFIVPGGVFIVLVCRSIVVALVSGKLCIC